MVTAVSAVHGRNQMGGTEQWEWVVRTCTWDMRLTHTFDLSTPCCSTTTTVGAAKNETLVFINFSAQDASILKISVAIIKRRS